MIDTNKIAVLGGGSGGHTMAADLTLKGYTVNFCSIPERTKTISTCLECQSIELIDLYGKQITVKPNMITTNLAEALRGVSYIMMNFPANATEQNFISILPYLEDGQTVIKISANFSALILSKILKEKGIKKDITLAETNTLPWGCRIIAPGTVRIAVESIRLLLATLPAKNVDRVIKDVKHMYPVVAGENVLATSFNNLNPVVHPIGTLMNAGWIETIKENFHFYREGTTPAVSRGIKAVFEETCALSKAVGVTMLDQPEENFTRKSAIMSTYFRAAFDKEGLVASISGPASMDTRYITEDLPYGLVPMVHLARQFKVATPIIDGIIALASVVNQTDYLKEGLSLKDLGLQGLNKEQIAKALQEGF